jgi:hypothetical protein
VFLILNQRIDTVKVETDVIIHNEQDVIGMETDAVCVPQGCEPHCEMVLWWWLLVCIVVCGFAHMELLRLVDWLSCLCVWSFASVTVLTVDSVSVLQYL